ncbi:MAG TPA: multicopper oxidase domain-containing protein, partial [Chloroflexota bacterium]|nr:multicopper oxidase domain-containing protein [Chloroflexota bacterium]
VFPTSPLVLNPFSEELFIPPPLAPARVDDPLLREFPPGPEVSRQDSEGWSGILAPTRCPTPPSKHQHQVWPSALGYPDPIIYHVKLQVGTHRFTKSSVLPIDSSGNPTASFDAAGNVFPAGKERILPESTIYGFNGNFDRPVRLLGTRINAEYGKPCLVRFENELGLTAKTSGLDLQDFGSREREGFGFLTHLHNGHTAPESDGNPHHRPQGYRAGQWVDNLYLNYPAGGDDREKQSFFWFHDHYHDHTGANVYKGLVGLYPIYDPKDSLDMGDETKGLRLPGVRTNNPDGSFDVDYDLPLVLYDCRLEDGVTQHKDFHTGTGETHPEWWGKTFFRHFPNHGFVGDIFTVNGTAYPVLEVKRRKYRLRFLDASVARIYELKLMSSTGGPKTAVSLGYGGDELQGQYRLPDGQQCMKFTQIASEGGLLPYPVVRDSFELWPAKRREFIVDFTTYQDGSPTKKYDVIYLVNVLKMRDGRKPDSPDPAYKVPVLKIVIGDDAPDYSLMPTATTLLRPLPDLPPPGQMQTLLDNRRVFRLERGSAGGEIEWLINGEPFAPCKPLASPKQGTTEVWELQNGGGGWSHPMHLHQEEHRVVMRNGQPVPSARHPDDVSKEDTIALDPGESVVVIRQFRDFTGRYVAHCHNLAHEDHSMMFGWEIVDAPASVPAATPTPYGSPTPTPPVPTPTPTPYGSPTPTPPAP